MDMLQSADYTLKDIVNSYYKGFKLIYSQQFIEELADNNFMDSIREIDIPVTFIHGSKDYHVHGNLVQQFVDQLVTKDKRFIWVDQSAHLFHPQDTKLIEQILIEQRKHYDHRDVNIQDIG
ncbi:hypothetical protein [Radiobacillus sp. PE A8.2]|uniref:hypothetical protein n=1 Tax=Radiobacillus sp. PE A8.2 TaxID=3380349 RepID=UPI00388DA589